MGRRGRGCRVPRVSGPSACARRLPGKGHDTGRVPEARKHILLESSRWFEARAQVPITEALRVGGRTGRFLGQVSSARLRREAVRALIS